MFSQQTIDYSKVKVSNPFEDVVFFTARLYLVNVEENSSTMVIPYFLWPIEKKTAICNICKKELLEKQSVQFYMDMHDPENLVAMHSDCALMMGAKIVN